MTTEREYVVTHTVRQTVTAESAEQAERIATRALEFASSLWWPSVEHVGTASAE